MAGMLRHELGDGVTLRALEDSDADELYAVIAANRDHLARWLPWAAGQTHAATRAFVRRTRGQRAAGNGLHTAILDAERIVGVIGVHGIDRHRRTTTLGYWLAADAQGRGLMTRAAGAYVDHAFTTWGLHRVEIRAATGNHRSRAVAQRLGFAQEGIRRGAERVGGRWVDHVVYARLNVPGGP
jgi:ribosomal-protein-serine acetyltransferase